MVLLRDGDSQLHPEPDTLAQQHAEFEPYSDGYGNGQSDSE